MCFDESLVNFMDCVGTDFSICLMLILKHVYHMQCECACLDVVPKHANASLIAKA